MEKYMKRAWAAMLNSLLLFGISIGLMALVSMQVRNFAEDWPEIQEQMTPKIEQLKTFALEHTPLDPDDINQSKDEESDAMGSDMRKKITAFLSGLSSFMANYLLTFVYVFFLLNYVKSSRIFYYGLCQILNRNLLKIPLQSLSKLRLSIYLEN